jgi:proteasome-associated ATPase
MVFGSTSRNDQTNSPEYLQQQIAQATAEQSRIITELNETVRECQTVIVRQQIVLNKLMGDSFYHGLVYEIHDRPRPSAFQPNDKVLVVDQDSPFYNQVGVIQKVSTELLADGASVPFGVHVRLLDASQSELFFTIGTAGEDKCQVKLAEKDDGTYVIVLIDGKPWEVRGGIGLNIQVGDTVTIRADNKRIVAKGTEFNNGLICRVQKTEGDWAEVEDKGERRFLPNPRKIALKQDDRVVVDTSFSIILKKLPKADNDRYKLTADPLVTWDKIGGLEDAKRQIREAIELPFLHPELFQYYGINKDRGVLLYGAPGCGKSLIARAAATALVSIHGKQASNSGFLYVKSPELLDKWIGNTESYIRQNFTIGREHYREHGYPAIHVYDEADALMPQRGTRKSSDISDTIVPMFLGEMDGVDEAQSAANPIIFLLTNRADTLDPAVTRPGRISRHIKIDRPDLQTGLSILEIHSAEIPFADEDKKKLTLAITINDLFSKTRLLYRLNGEYDFTLGECVNGAMIASVAEMAKLNALNRDIANKTRSGVTVEDFRHAIEKLYEAQRGLNHSFDLEDYASTKGILSDKMVIDRCFGSK